MNCWEGCIARVIVGVNVGAWVLCRSLSRQDSLNLGQPVWEIELLSAALVAPSIWRDDSIMRMPGYVAFCADDILRPVPPDELRDVTPTEESLPCHAL